MLQNLTWEGRPLSAVCLARMPSSVHTPHRRLFFTQITPSRNIDEFLLRLLVNASIIVFSLLCIAMALLYTSYWDCSCSKETLFTDACLPLYKSAPFTMEISNAGLERKRIGLRMSLDKLHSMPQHCRSGATRSTAIQGRVHKRKGFR